MTISGRYRNGFGAEYHFNSIESGLLIDHEIYWHIAVSGLLSMLLQDISDLARCSMNKRLKGHCSFPSGQATGREAGGSDTAIAQYHRVNQIPKGK
jgi:hypothetical protein